MFSMGNAMRFLKYLAIMFLAALPAEAQNIYGPGPAPIIVNASGGYVAYATASAINCSSNAACSAINHVAVQSVIYAGIHGAGFYTWANSCPGSPDGSAYIQPSGATGCFAIDGDAPQATAGVFKFNDSGSIVLGTATVSNGGGILRTSRALTNSNWSANAHAIEDDTSFGLTSGDFSLNSFDARGNMVGTGTFDHYAGFQVDATMASSGTLDKYYAFSALEGASAGTTNNFFGLYVFDPILSGGASVVNSYGVYCANLHSATTLNYCLYQQGFGSSHFDGNIEFQSLTAPTAGFAGAVPTITLGDAMGANGGGVIRVNRALSNANFNTNAHGFEDDTSFALTGNQAINSFDARAQITTTGLVNHYAGFQEDSTTSGSGGTVTSHYSFIAEPTFTNGTTVSAYGLYVNDPAVSGGGAVTNFYGLNCANLHSAVTNYCIFQSGTGAPSLLTGTLTVPEIDGPNDLILRPQVTNGACVGAGNTCYVRVNSATPLNWSSSGPFSGGALTVGGVNQNSSLWVNTPSFNSSFNSGLGVSGSFNTLTSTVNLTAYGVNSNSFLSTLVIGTTSGTSNVTNLTLNGQGDAVIGQGAISTSATDGFFYIASGPGTPTGTPTAFTGRVPMYYDTTNHQFWIYDSGWKQPKTPAGAALVTWQ